MAHTDDTPPNPNRSPRAHPLPPMVWAEEVIPREQRDPKKKTPKVLLAYENAKPYLLKGR